MEVPVLDGLQAPSPGGWRTIIRVPPLPISGFTEPDWPCTACQTLCPYSGTKGTLLCFGHHGPRRPGGRLVRNQCAGLSPLVALSSREARDESPCNDSRSGWSRPSGRRSRRMVSNDEHGRLTLHRKVVVYCRCPRRRNLHARHPRQVVSRVARASIRACRPCTKTKPQPSRPGVKRKPRLPRPPLPFRPSGAIRFALTRAAGSWKFVGAGRRSHGNHLECATAAGDEYVPAPSGAASPAASRLPLFRHAARGAPHPVRAKERHGQGPIERPVSWGLRPTARMLRASPAAAGRYARRLRHPSRTTRPQCPVNFTRARPSCREDGFRSAL